MCALDLTGLKDFIEPIVQIAAAFLAAWVVIWQVGKQREGELFLQKENLKTDFKIKLHGEIEEKISKLSDATVVAGGIKWRLSSGFTMQQASIDQGIQPAPLSSEMSEFNSAYNQLAQDTIEVIKVIEKYEIIEPAIKIFQTAFNVTITDLRNAYSPLMLELLNVLPQRSPDGQNIIYKPAATPAQMMRINQLADTYWEATNEIGSFVYDFRIEIQNLLLGTIFEHRIPKRNPLDPKYVVITTDSESVAKLQKYFEEETAWGRDKRAAEQRFQPNTPIV